jgi:hypothetical protein
MTDNELDEAACRRVVLKLRGEDPGEERPTSRSYRFDDPTRFERWERLRAENSAKADAEKAKAEPKPAPVTDWAANERWFDEKIAAFVDASVGPAVDRIAEHISELHDELEKERDRIRELEIRASQQDIAIGKRDVAIERQNVAIAELQLRLANGRTGAAIDVSPTLKTIN